MTLAEPDPMQAADTCPYCNAPILGQWDEGGDTCYTYECQTDWLPFIYERGAVCGATTAEQERVVLTLRKFAAGAGKDAHALLTDVADFFEQGKHRRRYELTLTLDNPDA